MRAARRGRCVRRAWAWNDLAMHDLEVLDRIFQCDNAAVTVFEVDLSWLDELLDLLSTQIDRGRKIPGRAAVQKLSRWASTFLPRRLRDMAQFDESRSKGAARPSTL